jgi:hypothetical protein
MNDNIYKIGKYKRENLKRICKYSNHLHVHDCNDLETIDEDAVIIEKYPICTYVDVLLRSGIEKIYKTKHKYILGYFKLKNEDTFLPFSNIEDIIYDNLCDSYEIPDIKTLIIDILYSVEHISAEVVTNFPNFQEDECFGGQKKLCKIVFEQNVSTYYISCLEILYGEIDTTRISSDEMSNYDIYFHTLLDNDNIFNQCIFDLNHKHHKQSLQVSILNNEYFDFKTDRVGLLV